MGILDNFLNAAYEAGREYAHSHNPDPDREAQRLYCTSEEQRVFLMGYNDECESAWERYMEDITS